MNDNTIKIQICRDDFYLMMRNAVVQSGGADDIKKWKSMRLDEIVDFLAHNGLRMVYMPEKHMDSIKIIWEDPKKPLSLKDLPTVPKKKQLLCDQMDRGDEENDPICTD